MTAKFFVLLKATVSSWSGAGYISGALPDGVVTVGGAPAAREVECRHRRSRTVMAVVFSRADGTYRFDNLDPKEEYDIIGRDYLREYSDVVVPAVKPIPY